MNSTRKKAALLTIALAAIIAIPNIGTSAGFEASTTRAEKAFGPSVNEAIAAIRPKDVFAEIPQCRIVDAMTIRAYTLTEAAQKFQPCVAAISGRYAIPVTARVGVVAATPRGRGAVLGIQIRIEISSLPENNPLRRDLQHSLGRRNGLILGHRARVLVGHGTFRAQIQSSLQEILDRCILPQYVPPMKTSNDFLAYYGGCLSREPRLRITRLQPISLEEKVIEVWSDADSTVVARMNGSILVSGAHGPVTFFVEAKRR